MFRFFIFLALSTVFADFCQQECHHKYKLCEMDCRDNQHYKINVARIRQIHEPIDITGSSYHRNTLFLAARIGIIYQVTDTFLPIINVSEHYNVLLNNDCGLYDIAVSDNYDTSGIILAYFAEIDDEGQIHNTIAYFDAFSNNTHRITSIKQLDDKRSGGWMYLNHGTGNLLFFSNGGNQYEIDEVSARHPELSTITYLHLIFNNGGVTTFHKNPLNQDLNNHMFATNVGNPTKCSKLRRWDHSLWCLSELTKDRMALMKVMKHTNYGEKSKMSACKHDNALLCQEKMKQPNMITHVHTHCPVTDMVLWERSTSMFFNKPLVITEACDGHSSTIYAKAPASLYPVHLNNTLSLKLPRFLKTKYNVYLSGVSTHTGYTELYQLS